MKQGIENELKRIRQDREGQTLESQVDGSLNEAYIHATRAANIIGAAQRIRENEQYGHTLSYERKVYLETEVKALQDSNRNLHNKVTHHLREIESITRQKDSFEAEIRRLNDKVLRYQEGVEYWKKKSIDADVSKRNAEAEARSLVNDPKLVAVERISSLETALHKAQETANNLRKERNELWSAKYSWSGERASLLKENERMRNSNNRYMERVSDLEDQVSDMEKSVKKMDAAMTQLALNYATNSLKLNAVRDAVNTGGTVFLIQTRVGEILDGS